MDSVRFRFDDVEIDPACYAVTRAGRSVALEPKAVTLLLYLLEHRARVVTKDELADHLWRDTFVTPNALTRLVAQLRRELGDAAHEARYIQTVHRRGYRFIANVTAVAAPAPSAAAPARADVSAAAGPGASRRLPRLAIAAASLVFVAALGAAVVRSRLDLPWPSVDPRAVRSAAQVTASLGLDADPALSPDGRLLAWSSDASGRSEIFVKEVDRGVERQVTRDGLQNVEPAWSPDGRWIAYRSGLRRGIWVVAATGGEPRRIAEFGARPAWSPDGRRIAFGASGTVMAARTQIWSVRPDGTDLRPLTTAGTPDGVHQMPKWSPDGSRLAFVAGGPGHAALWIQDLASGRLTGVREEHVVTGLAFEPAGGALLWAEASRLSPGRVWRQPLDRTSGRPSGAPVVLATTGTITSPTGLAAGGGRIAWVSTRVATNLWALPLGRGQPAGPPRPLTRTTYRNTFPVFSPDGARIAFQLKRPGADTEVWTIPADGGDATPALPGDTRGFFPAWMPGGDRVFAVEHADGGERFAALDVRAGRRDVMRAVNRERHPRLSPDGRSVAYHAPVDGTLQVFIAPVEGGPARQVTFSPTDAAYPSWAPDGQRLALEVRTGEDVHVAVAPAAGGPVRLLTSGHGVNWPHSWAPDNDRIAFAGERGGRWEIYAVSSRTGAVGTLTAFDTPNGYVRYPAWSPADDAVVFERAEPRGNIWVASLPAGDDRRDGRTVVDVNRIEERQR
jgi:Tol biopolymer transport system component/DNA-binding winged helix-turn-helix (wHTH) protein